MDGSLRSGLRTALLTFGLLLLAVAIRAQNAEQPGTDLLGLSHSRRNSRGSNASPIDEVRTASDVKRGTTSGGDERDLHAGPHA